MITYLSLFTFFFFFSTVSKYSWMFDVILLRMEVFYHNIHSRYQAIDGVTRYLVNYQSSFLSLIRKLVRHLNYFA